MKKKMEIKKLIGNNSYWTINKKLAQEVGLESTLILQHLIDLEENYFKGEFWQKSKSIQEATGLSKYKVKTALTNLSNANLLIIENKVPNNSATISKVYHFEILKDNIVKLFNKHQLNDLTSVSKNSLPTSVKEFNQVDKEKENKEKTNKVLDVPSDDDIKGTIFFKMVDKYPANRIGNRQHGLKKFKKLDMEQAVLCARNLKRYLACVSEPKFVKSLQNYITEECWTEAWLLAEETKNKPDTKYKSDGKTINTTHIDKF